jgi:tRNA pseudouridine65 synthase
MAHIRHPIIGDSTHGDLRQNRGVAEYFGCHRLMLHASRLQLNHPVTGETLSLSACWGESWQGLMSHFGWPGIIPEVERVAFPATAGQDSG